MSTHHHHHLHHRRYDCCEYLCCEGRGLFGLLFGVQVVVLETVAYWPFFLTLLVCEGSGFGDSGHLALLLNPPLYCKAIAKMATVIFLPILQDETLAIVLDPKTYKHK